MSDPSPLLGSEPAALAVAAALLASYLVGAVPFGWLMARVLHGVDLRKEGSGNIGATNAMRVLGRPLGLVAFLLDFAKGYGPVALFGSGSPRLEVACGAAAVCGHVWPVYLRFRGGKAVATSCGALGAIDPLIVAGATLTWLAVFAATRYVSLASIAMGVSFPVLAGFRVAAGLHHPLLLAATLALALLILVRHRSNMARILAGEEPRSEFFRRLRGGKRSRV